MLYPFKFKPRFVQKMWGGRRIETSLGKKLPPQHPIGESWELFDFPPGVIDASPNWVSSEIANGPFAGRSLHSVILDFGRAVHGDVPLLAPAGQFPILIKYLDARENLSVQVHPDQTYTSSHPGTHLKTEAWYVVENDPGAKLYHGLKAGATRDAFAQAIQNGAVDALVNALPVKAGDCFYLPSGTVHALGAGILVAEVQTPSDTTFRVFDFNRVDPASGKPRSLHVAEALQCIDFHDNSPPQQTRTHVAQVFSTVSRLLTCPYFTIEKVRFSEGVEQTLPYDQPVVWMMLHGKAQLRVEQMSEPTHLAKGDTLLLPARMRNPTLKTLTDCVWLEVTFPTKASTGH